VVRPALPRTTDKPTAANRHSDITAKPSNGYESRAAASVSRLPRRIPSVLRSASAVMDMKGLQPQLPYGYATVMLIAMIPPLWRRIMD
jgi:hypothetical protein